MSIQVLNENDYYRSVYGGWLGKNIGGALGARDEGNKERLHLSFYPVLPDGPMENDDLDLQLVWLHALEQYGPKLTAKELGQEWIEHVFFPFDEYGYALANLRRGLQAPVAGSFNNPFTHCMGSPIRSEIWAMVTPGCPHLAVRYAYEDAIVDHAGGEGVYGEMFFAAIESAIFFEKDRDRLLSIGLGYIPENCRTARAVRDIIAWHRQGIEWTTAREMIIKHHGNDNFTDAPQNVAFTILGWLYGDDFEDAILKAVNCGYDTDCTAATLGAILGMIMGLTNLPLKWTDPLGDGIVVSKPVKGFDIPRNLHELTARTIRMGRKVLAAWEADIFIHCELPTNLDGAPGGADQEIRDMWTRDVNGNRWLLPENSAEAFGLELKLSYGAGGPVIGVSHQKQLSFTLTNHSLESWEGRLSLDVPERWECEEPISAALEPGETFHFAFRITSSGELMPSYECSLRISRWHDVQQWAEIKVPFTLIAASHWLLEGPESLQGEAAVSGNRIDWHSTLGTDQTGLYRAVTRMIVPEARNVRLIVAANCRATVNLNGEQLLSFDEGADFMPAFHRAPSEQYAELSMESGSYELEVIAAKTANPLQVYVLPVSTGQTKQPGPYYYFTDILFGPPL